MADATKANTGTLAAIPAGAVQFSSSGIEVEEASPQASHSQWWRISPPSTNSEEIGATIQSPQLGQRVGAAKARIAEIFG
ncbi:MAG: hypothetical protein ACYCZX_19695 [Rhodospirillaceae bacterium]